MCRLLAPVWILLFLQILQNASSAGEAPPLEAIWRLEHSVLGVPTLPSDIASAPDGSVYLVEVGVNRVQKFDSEGRLLERWGAPEGEAGDLRKPFGVAVGPDDSVYVTELGRNRVRHFDAAGMELRSWGGLGTEPGKFWEPRGIAVDPEGHVYVVDGENHRVQCFTNTGDFLHTWGGEGDRPGSLRTVA